MTFRVTSIRHELSGNYVVGFASYIGNARATWHGEEPIVDEEYNVEVNVGVKLTWGLNIKPCRNDAPRIWLEDDTCYIQGRLRIQFAHLDDVDTDYYLQVGHWIVTPDAVLNAPSEEQPCVVAVPCRSVELFPYHI